MFDVKFNQFFDRDHVIRKVKDGTKSVLSKAGAFIRRRAKSLIRKRKRTAVPGSPPSSHRGLLRDNIFFGYDSVNESVVVGPRRLNAVIRTGDESAPELLEFGGRVRRGNETASYRQFPYMAPALEDERDKFAELFANSVRE